MHPVVVIGGGPAGLFAAEILAVAGIPVTVYEYRRSVGRKFLLAGRGGLNITHAEPLDVLLDRYGPARSRLESAIRSFDADDLRAWCAGHGEPTFTGTSDRVFPASFRATPLLRAWLRRLDDLGVEFKTGRRWTGWSDDGRLMFMTHDNDVESVAADATVFALGGASWPRVGSDAGWVTAFEAAGIAVTPLQAANCGVTVDWTQIMRTRFAGSPIKNAVFTVGDHASRGDAVVTETGLEGGPIYALGPGIRRQLVAEPHAVLTIDLFPDLTGQALTDRLSKRRPKSSVASWLGSASVPPVAVALSREVTGNELPTAASSLASLFKALPIVVTGLESLDRAISTAGGVSLDEIDDHFMLRSRPGTFLAGEMLDWEAPTGGYLLQGCFSTGAAAARGAMRWLEQQPWQ